MSISSVGSSSDKVAGSNRKKKKKRGNKQKLTQVLEKASKTRRCTADKGSDEGKQTKCFSSMIRTHSFLQEQFKSKDNGLFSSPSTFSCVPLLDRKSQWHLFPVALGFRLQYHLLIPWFSTKLILCSCPDAEDLKMMRTENNEEQAYTGSIHKCPWPAINWVQNVNAWQSWEMT